LAAAAAVEEEGHQEAAGDSEEDLQEAPEDHQEEAEEAADHQRVVPVQDQDKPQEGPN